MRYLAKLRRALGSLSAHRQGVGWRTAALHPRLRAARPPARGKTSACLPGCSSTSRAPASNCVAENAFLRHQLLVAGFAGIKKPRFGASDRVLLVALAAMFARWRDARGDRHACYSPQLASQGIPPALESRARTRSGGREPGRRS